MKSPTGANSSYQFRGSLCWWPGPPVRAEAVPGSPCGLRTSTGSRVPSVLLGPGSWHRVTWGAATLQQAGAAASPRNIFWLWGVGLTPGCYPAPQHAPWAVPGSLYLIITPHGPGTEERQSRSWNQGLGMRRRKDLNLDLQCCKRAAGYVT